MKDFNHLTAVVANLCQQVARQRDQIAALTKRLDAMEPEHAAMQALLSDRFQLHGNVNAAPDRPTPRQIIAKVAVATGITSAEIIGDSKVREVVMARQLAMSLCAEHGYSTPTIGKALGGRDHSTVVHGIKAHRKRVAA